MCGIFGLLVVPNSSLKMTSSLDILDKLYVLSQSRGKDASGLMTLNSQRIGIVKSPISGKHLIKTNQYKLEVRKAVKSALQEKAPVLFMGHTRMVTNGSTEIHENNQPVRRNDLVCIHNGIIVNDESIWQENPSFHRKSDVDTEAFLALVEFYRRSSQSLPEAIAQSLQKINGANSFALISAADDMLILTTTNGSLYYSICNEGQVLIFASERFILEKTIRNKSLCALFTNSKIVQLSPEQVNMYSLHKLQPITLFNESNEIVSQPAKAQREIEDVSPKSLSSSSKVLQNSISQVEKAFSIDISAIRELKRCTKCIIPETFPFIQFDEKGICSLCQMHKPKKKYGAAALRDKLEVIRRSDGLQDCLVPISGGRDSCYGLHYIKKELNLNPVAYTYDWGMVTDLARRNISRMCGELGVEHILISADIPRKLENIRLNVAAWLRRPHLGMIPLFMAGDKQFFYYANMLCKQMNLSEIIFSVNALEQTDFKVGFCDINDMKGIYSLSSLGKMRLLSFYGKQFIQNPTYLNRSILDTFLAFFTYYIQPKNHISLFDYLDWSESLVVTPLIRDYGWETAKDTCSTWRIGDGTAAFYNYIYLQVAGFTENDTFRSNQIREGLISREEALIILEEENFPRAESFAWYCNKIGIDAVDAIKRINLIPRRYAV